MLKREDLGDDRDPNPDKGQQYQQPDLTSETIPGRSFAGANVAADQRHQAETRNSGPPDRGNRTDDVQLADRTDRAGDAGSEAGDADRARRTNSARTARDVERREETDENL